MEFPDSLVVKMRAFTIVDPGTIPDQGTKISQAAAKKKEKTWIILILF